MSKKLLYNNVNENQPNPPEDEGHYYDTYTNYPIEIEDENLCMEHKSYLTEIYGNTENGKMVGVEQSDGTYKISLNIIGNTP